VGVLIGFVSGEGLARDCLPRYVNGWCGNALVVDRASRIGFRISVATRVQFTVLVYLLTIGVFTDIGFWRPVVRPAIYTDGRQQLGWLCDTI
jgi:hypothetical protein